MEDQTLQNLSKPAPGEPSGIMQIATALDYSTAATADWALRFIATNTPEYAYNAMYCKGLSDAFRVILGLLSAQGDGGYDMNELLNGRCFSAVDCLKDRSFVHYTEIGSAYV